MEVLAGLRLADADAPYGGFVVKLNHRRLLDAMLAVAGVPPHKFRCHISVTQICRETPLLPVLQTRQGIRHRQSETFCPRHMHHLSARIRIPLCLGKYVPFFIDSMLLRHREAGQSGLAASHHRPYSV